MLALRLVQHFGGLAAVFNASAAELEGVVADGLVVHLIRSAGEAVRESLAGEVRGRSVSARCAKFRQHLRSMLAGRRDEAAVAVYLDNHHRYLGADLFESGSPNRIVLELRKLMGGAILRGSHDLILAHNHPGGQARPSAADYQASRDLAEVGKRLRVTLVDHLIVGNGLIFSMREGGAIHD